MSKQSGERRGFGFGMASSKELALPIPDEVAVSLTASVRDGAATVYGQPTNNGQPQAQLRHDTVCTRCGKRFLKGHVATAHLAIPPEQATWHHTDCDDPTLGGVQ